MADLFSVKTPLAIRYPDGTKKIMLEYFASKDGLLYLEPYWHLQPASLQMNRVTGEIKGDGPWKVGDCVVTVLGCHGTDPELAQLFAQWQFYMQTEAEDYPDQNIIYELAESHGASI